MSQARFELAPAQPLLGDELRLRCLVQLLLTGQAVARELLGAQVALAGGFELELDFRGARIAQGRFEVLAIDLRPLPRPLQRMNDLPS